MATEPHLPGPSPAWYKRLPPPLQRVAAASDRVTSLPLRPGAVLVQAVSELPGILASARAAEVQVQAQRIADGVCTAFRVAKVWIRVAEKRPHDQRGELHGLYTPGVPPARDTITLWMFTAKRAQVVAARTFLRTLLHELCHHLDYTHLRLRDSLHTQGFYRRESSLFLALGADRIDSTRAVR
ncbi:MAG: hypothetical protein ACREQL_16520 [Candidatus Binatia bacterium]